MGWHRPHPTDHVKRSVNVCADCWITPLNRRVIADGALLEACRGLLLELTAFDATSRLTAERCALLARLDERLAKEPR